MNFLKPNSANKNSVFVLLMFKPSKFSTCNNMVLISLVFVEIKISTKIKNPIGTGCLFAVRIYKFHILSILGDAWLYSLKRHTMAGNNFVIYFEFVIYCGIIIRLLLHKHLQSACYINCISLQGFNIHNLYLNLLL